MSDSYTNLLYHIVFSTKDRRPLITHEYEVRLYDYIGGTLRRTGGISLELNGTEDHIHLLAKLRPDRSLSEVLRDLKANATGWMHDVFPSLKESSWQRSLSANQMLRKFGDTLRGRKNIMRWFRFGMSSFNS
ncbi:MAG: IS200/IS605 family transposase [Acidobacteria bacterium]|nr:MAG: IS200/IS605 family transposase [Acidobacteriota bacterium]